MKKFSIAMASASVLFFSFHQAWAVTAYEAPPGGWHKNSFGASFNTEYFMSQANYSDTRGSYERLIGDSKFRSFESRLRGRYNLSDRLSLFAGSSYTSSHAIDTLNDKANSQITALSAGADFLLVKKYVHLIPELEGSLAIDKSDINQTQPLTSDGVSYLRAGVFAYRPYKIFRFGAYGGVHLPAEGLAKRLLYEATVDFKISSIFTVGAGIDGYETMLSDESTLMSRIRTAQLADAGSARFLSYDPALLEGRAWVGIRPDRTFWLRVGYAKTLNGMHTAEGQSFLLSLVYNSPQLALRDGKPAQQFTPEDANTPAQPTKRPNVDQAIKGFQPDAERTDQDIFESQEQEVLPSEGKSDLDRTEKMLEKKTEQQDK